MSQPEPVRRSASKLTVTAASWHFSSQLDPTL